MNPKPFLHSIIRHLPSAEPFCLVFWLGSMWFAGLVVAPLSFEHLSSPQAGGLAGALFTAVFYLSIPCALVVLLAVMKDPSRKGLFPLIWLLILSSANELLLHPLITVVKEISISNTWFGLLHGGSTVLYLLNCAIGLWLVKTRWGAKTTV